MTNDKLEINYRCYNSKLVNIADQISKECVEVWKIFMRKNELEYINHITDSFKYILNVDTSIKNDTVYNFIYNGFGNGAILQLVEKIYNIHNIPPIFVEKLLNFLEDDDDFVILATRILGNIFESNAKPEHVVNKLIQLLKKEGDMSVFLKRYNDLSREIYGCDKYGIDPDDEDENEYNERHRKLRLSYNYAATYMKIFKGHLVPDNILEILLKLYTENTDYSYLFGMENLPAIIKAHPDQQKIVNELVELLKEYFPISDRSLFLLGEINYGKEFPQSIKDIIEHHINSNIINCGNTKEAAAKSTFRIMKGKSEVDVKILTYLELAPPFEDTQRRTYAETFSLIFEGKNVPLFITEGLLKLTYNKDFDVQCISVMIIGKIFRNHDTPPLIIEELPKMLNYGADDWFVRYVLEAIEEIFSNKPVPLNIEMALIKLINGENKYLRDISIEVYGNIYKNEGLRNNLLENLILTKNLSFNVVTSYLQTLNDHQAIIKFLELLYERANPHNTSETKNSLYKDLDKIKKYICYNLKKHNGFRLIPPDNKVMHIEELSKIS